MTQYWEPGTQYNNGDIVLFEGHRYKIVQPHRSQSDWTPPITPALWGKLQDNDCGGNPCDTQQKCNQQSGYQQSPCHQPTHQQPSYQQSQQNWQSDQKTEQHKEEHKWYDIDEDMKKKLQIGGGVAAGAALLAGGVATYKHHEKEKEHKHVEQGHSEHSNDKLKIAGGLAAGAAVAAGAYGLHKHHEHERDENHGGRSDSDEEGENFGWDHLDEDTKKKLKIGGGIAAGVAALGAGVAVYKAHEKSKEEKETHVRQSSEWLTVATKRTDEFYRRGPQEPVTWVLTHGKNIPQGAIEVSKERSWGLYICRAFIDGGIQPGKACADFPKGGVLGYEKEEHHVDTYEILLGNISQLRWVHVRGRLNPASVGRLVEGGYENDGTKLYVIKAQYPDNSGVYHPGKTSEKLDGAYIPYGGSEKNIKDYEVLCYA